MNRVWLTSSLLVACAALWGCPSDDTSSGGSSQVGGGTSVGAGGSGGGTPSAPAWQVVFDDHVLDRALLSVWGTSAKSVYVVGGPLKNSGKEALALHFDGSAWTDLKTGGADSYWWVTGTGDDDVWMLGENGRVTHYDGTKLTELDSGTTATLWGAIAFAKDDVWFVGGMVGGPGTTPDDVVLHYDGTSFKPEVLPGAAKNRALFKVWGTSSDDLFVVGEAGIIWHKKGPTWTLESEPPIAGGNLTTVHGCAADDVFAVGGRDILHYDGATWSKLDKGLGNDVNGVFCAQGGDVSAAIVGMAGLKQRLVDGTWQDEFVRAPHGDLHAVWADETGAFWAVGGEFVSSPKPNGARNGIVARYGPGTVSSTLK